MRLHRSIDLPSPDATTDFARWLSPRLNAGDAVLLTGAIGAGKTHFARALIQHSLAAVGCSEDVPSPTFTLVQVYDIGNAEIWHADLYRLGHPDEVMELGLEEAFASAITLIEWPDRLGGLAPEDALSLTFTDKGDGRTLLLEGSETWARRFASESLPDAFDAR